MARKPIGLGSGFKLKPLIVVLIRLKFDRQRRLSNFTFITISIQMNTFTSKVSINKPLKAVYDFLADFNNHRQLMPDNIQEWASTTDEARFSIQNMAKLALKISERVPDELITIIPAEKPPFDLELKWSLSFDNDHTDVVFTIGAELSMMMKMLASGPLQKLADHETQSLLNLLS
ncbi:hypothetical protein LX99_03034 [Mucilaginibacter oryzae]|uniref:Polyketide cyclase/dehydrase/lipid transport protein n=2 Tax=Mucilaginibacter oryzae TaxID=468058 RepID=A0A316H8B0_9SPHI|nr:hypothetical protein LX99_03034 [Mucilaginibacter oryzae]